MGKKNITFNDIAKYTGFSKTTVSRYFNNPDSLTLKNQQIISDALDKLNYQENKVARILANGKTEFIGVIIPNLYLHYYSEMLNQILKTYDTYGYKFLVFTGDDHKSTERKYIQELLSYKIEGMVILSHTIPSRELASYNLPIVTIEREDQFVSSVNTDNYMGAVQATSLLAKTGADILIHINVELSPQVPSYGRIKGFSDICEEYQIPHELILTDTGHSYEESSLILKDLLETIDSKYQGKTKGIFLPNDTFANIMLNHMDSFQMTTRLLVLMILQFPVKLLFRSVLLDSRLTRLPHLPWKSCMNRLQKDTKENRLCLLNRFTRSFLQF